MKADRPHEATFGGKYINISTTKYVYQKIYHISNNSNKLTNQMQYFHKFITGSLCVAQHVSGVSTPNIRSL
jgi:hypothetical protein